jgi:outer membrane protein OmpA-like peptidoglycan-associated protein
MAIRASDPGPEENSVAAFGKLGSGVAAAVASAVLAGCGSVSGLETEARILAEPTCTDFFFPIYFGSRSAEITAAAGRVIRSAGRHAQDCQGTKVEVVGLPDPQGAAGSDLSRQRGRHLSEALQAAGLPSAAFQPNPLGPGAPPPLERRRADVFIRFQR